ncbi:MAG: GDP-mannose 4,6-dehydratase [Pseudomonadales bacterium]|nr:GDP-mannose 4,6-dehydratase [Pseudomonadales bacterium]
MDQPKILITGGTGFAGSHLVEALQSKGFENIHTTSFGGGSEYLANLIGKANIHQLDLTNAENTNILLKELVPDQIYHLASFAYVGKSFEKADELLANNITLQLNLLKAVKDFVPKARLLVVGSAEEYGVSKSEDELPCDEDHKLRPINPYAVSKIAQDMLAYSYHISFNLDIVTVRPFNHIGERQSPDFAIPAFATQIVAIENGSQDKLRVGNLSAIRDFTDVKDMMLAYIIVMNKGETGEVYNIGSGVGIKMSEVVKKLASLSIVKIDIEEDPSRIRPLDIPKMVAKNDKIKSLGWTPTISLDDSLARIIDSIRNKNN